ncbi:hypothetical protein J6590_049218 [Homalodisca vitripennis]|nr:hypothetical protein J6590_049218 [Homalodisca vitripennis]
MSSMNQGSTALTLRLRTTRRCLSASSCCESAEHPGMTSMNQGSTALTLSETPHDETCIDHKIVSSVCLHPPAASPLNTQG